MATSNDPQTLHIGDVTATREGADGDVTLKSTSTGASVTLKAADFQAIMNWSQNTPATAGSAGEKATTPAPGSTQAPQAGKAAQTR